MEGLAQYVAGNNTTTHYYAGADSTPKKQGVKKMACKTKKKSTKGAGKK